MSEHLIYHLTHIDNLPTIIEHGAIWSKNHLMSSGLQTINIAHQNIQQRRSQRLVPCAPYGVLHDYVPFYFATRSPMLYAIYKNRVQDYHGEQDSIIYLVSGIEKLQATKQQFVFTDGHAATDFAQFFVDLADLDQIDWGIMKELYWQDTEDDNNRKWRRQAECLVYHSCPLDAFHGIAVKNEFSLNKVKSRLEQAQLSLPVRIRQEWYF